MKNILLGYSTLLVLLAVGVTPSRIASSANRGGVIHQHHLKMAAAATDDCTGISSCFSCTDSAPQGNCGWCRDKCMLGSGIGPSGGIALCDGTAWHWSSRSCPVATPAPTSECAFTSCAECTTGGGGSAPEGSCGWCGGESGHCYQGMSTGPANATCVGAPWHWGGKHCPTPSPTPIPTAIPSVCTQLTDCYKCTANTDCGWCNGTCFRGSFSGPQTPGVCQGSSWRYEEYNCIFAPPTPSPGAPPPTPVPSSHCTSLTSCLDCAYAEIGDCGWCDDKCLLGAISGPRGGSFQCNGTAWHFYGEYCPATPAPPPTPVPAPTPPTPIPASFCPSITSCHACTQEAPNNNCGWCDGKCLLGNETGPDGGNDQCHDGSWHFNGEYCPPTPAPLPAADCPYYSCLECTRGPSEGCGWCGGQAGHCYRGNTTGPVNISGITSCPAGDAWHWEGAHCPVPPATPIPTAAVSHCTQWDNCLECTEFSSCGWCNGACFLGDSSRPMTPGVCGATSWHFYGQHCPTPAPTPEPPADCSQYMGCNRCINSPSVECGWCTTTGVCSQGSYNGPANKTGCPLLNNWVFYGYTCPTN